MLRQIGVEVTHDPLRILKQRFAWMKQASASGSNDNVLDEKVEKDKALKSAIGSQHWLSEATGTQAAVVN